MEKVYLGDGVYAEKHVSGGVELTTERETGIHRIVLDPERCQELTTLLDRWNIVELF